MFVYLCSPKSPDTARTGFQTELSTTSEVFEIYIDKTNQHIWSDNNDSAFELCNARSVEELFSLQSYGTLYEPSIWRSPLVIKENTNNNDVLRRPVFCSTPSSLMHAKQ